MNRRDRVRRAARYAVDLPRFLHSPIGPAEARRRIAKALADRERGFLELVEHGIYANGTSPYRRLLAHAGVELGDLRHLVLAEGVEGSLGQLFDAGVRITLDEFKGRRPVVRPGLELPVALEAFDNPLASVHLVRRTGGSRGVPRRVPTDLRLLAHEACHHRLFLDAHGLAGRPTAIWSGQPASSARVALRHVKAGESVARWLSKKPLASGEGDRLLRYAIAVSRVVGPGRIAAPEYVPIEEAPQVARWLAAQASAGRPALLETPASTGVRVCLAARDEGLDVAGTFLRFAGEPYTPGKAEVVRAAGARAACHYSVSEVGRVGVACAAPEALDDVHLLTEKLAALQRPRPVAGGGTVQALHLTTLLTCSPKLMLNVEVDDYAVVETRDCGCPLGELGLTTHLREIRSYEKLTGEGINFLGDDLFVLVDETLPRRFGGAPTDYQLVEEEVDGIPRLGIVASPRVGELDEQAVIDAVAAALCADPRNRDMVDTWLAHGTLRVVRREPSETVGAKLLPLHLAAGAASPRS